MAGAIRIGISGWRYPGWRGVFYPKDLPQRAELEYAARRFGALEINGSFYSLQRPGSYQRWYEAAPKGFVFALKGSRYITHMLKLRDVATPLANFFASGVFNLREKLGPVLWQFPARFEYDRERMERFFDLLPRDTTAAARLARRHDARVRGRAQLEVDKHRTLRYAVEVRSESFADPAFIDLLRRWKIALVIADTAGRWPLKHDITADFVYIRLHGDVELYSSGYTEEALDEWARRIAAWQRGSEPRDADRISPRKPPARKSRDVYCFFDNDAKVRAPFDAQTLMHKLGMKGPGRRAGRARPAGRRRRITPAA